MHALTLLFAASALVCGAANATCPTPDIKVSGIHHAEKGPNYRWDWNSDGYPHLVVTDQSASTAQLRVSCSVMEEVILFGGRLAVVSVGPLGRPLKADVVLPSITVMDPYDTAFNAATWQRQAATLERSRLPGNVARVLAMLQDSSYIDLGWDMTFVQKDGVGSRMAYAFERGAKSSYGSRDARVTFTGDFNQPATMLAKMISSQLLVHYSS